MRATLRSFFRFRKKRSRVKFLPSPADIVLSKNIAEGRLSMGIIRMAPRDVNTAVIVRDYIGAGFQHAHFDSIRTFARNLEDGYRVFIKYGGGQNLFRAFNTDLTKECQRLEIDLDQLGDAVNTVAAYCVANEKLDGNGEWKFDDRLDLLNIELSDLVRLGREEFCILLPSNAQALKLVDELVRFQAIQQALKGSSVTVTFNGAPLNAIATDKPSIISRIHRAGYTIEQLEGAVAFMKDGTIEPVVDNGTVTVSALMQALGD